MTRIAFMELTRQRAVSISRHANAGLLEIHPIGLFSKHSSLCHRTWHFFESAADSIPPRNPAKFL